MEKINVAELLKDCPKGMELDCTMIDNVVFEKLDFISSHHPIIIRRTDSNKTIHLTKYGQYSDEEDYKCVIFPKGKTTWEGFVSPCQFKDGDVLVHTQNQRFIMSIYHKEVAKLTIKTHCILWDKGEGLSINEVIWCYADSVRLATEEEKARLFQAIKDNGYKWNPGTKTLEKFPKFKVGDRIRQKGETSTYTITDVNNAHYFCGKYVICDTCDNDWELVPNKFDITTLKPFESRVLVRDLEENAWHPAIWGCLGDVYQDMYPYIMEGGNGFEYCIPYEGNEHLLGTTDDCDDFYKVWKE